MKKGKDPKEISKTVVQLLAHCKGKIDLSQLITVLSSSTTSISLKNSRLKFTSQTLTLLGKRELLNTQINY